MHAQRKCTGALRPACAMVVVNKSATLIAKEQETDPLSSVRLQQTRSFQDG